MVSCQTGNTAAIRRVAVRETSVFRHHGVPIEDPLNETRLILQHYRIWEFKGVFQLLGRPLSREMLVSRIALRLIAVVFLVWVSRTATRAFTATDLYRTTDRFQGE